MRTRSSRWILVVAVAALLVALVGLAGCGGDDDSGKGGSSKGGSGGGSAAKVYGPGDSISVASGQTFVIELESNPTTGYEWTAADNPNATFVKSTMVTNSTLPGAPGTQQLTFKATTAGTSTLVLNYARSFEPNNPPAQTESFPLKVS